MKIMDKNGRFFGKINIIDITAVLLIIAGIVLVGLKLTSPDNGSNDTYVEYTMRIEFVREETYDALVRKTDGIYDAKSTLKPIIGDIVKIEKQPAKSLILLDDGSYTYAEYVDKFDINVTLVAKCQVTGSCYLVGNGTKLLCGDAIKLSNGYCETTGQITSVRLLSAEEAAALAK